MADVLGIMVVVVVILYRVFVVSGRPLLFLTILFLSTTCAQPFTETEAKYPLMTSL